jgi:N6-adenosine-specific RNA methylase IME4
MSDPFHQLPKGHYGAILADPPWHFQSWNGARTSGSIDVRTGKPFVTPEKAPEYSTMSVEQIAALPVADRAADDSVLFCWGIWVMLPQCLDIVKAWGFEYKTCAFNWTKAKLAQIDMFRDSDEGQLGLGYWVRQNTEFCLLATRGKPKRLAANIRQAIIEPRREHSRKPDCVHGRIERLVAGPYLELFARQQRPGWDCWGNETDKFNPRDDFAKSITAAYDAIKERQAQGGQVGNRDHANGKVGGP